MPPRPRNRLRAAGCWLLLGWSLLLAAGCEATTRYKVLSTLFDGVPSLPPAEELCRDFAREQLAAAATGEPGPGVAPAKAKEGSSHLPYREKRCNDCHDFGKPGGLISPKRELCFGCHKDFIQGSAVHGPVAVGDCLACHHPHTSEHPALLTRGKAEICVKCHQEKRLAARMHEQLRQNGMTCTDCHNPHFGHARYFLD